jgi:hypothetical protein
MADLQEASNGLFAKELVPILAMKLSIKMG